MEDQAFLSVISIHNEHKQKPVQSDKMKIFALEILVK